MKLTTVKIKTKDGFVIINEAEFDEKKHTLFEVTQKLAMQVEMPRKKVD